VHAEMTRREIRDGVPLVDPERDVIERVQLHARSLAIEWVATTCLRARVAIAASTCGSGL
jgi:hypothetical protein